MTEEFIEAWAAEAYRIQDSEPMLTWETCEMIAYVNLTKKYYNENLDRQVS